MRILRELLRRASLDPSTSFGDGSTYHIAEEIVGKTMVRGRTMHKVKWKDWPSWENSCQTLTDCKNVPKLAEAYKKAHTNAQGLSIASDSGLTLGLDAVGPAPSGAGDGVTLSC